MFCVPFLSFHWQLGCRGRYEWLWYHIFGQECLLPFWTLFHCLTMGNDLRKVYWATQEKFSNPQNFYKDIVAQVNFSGVQFMGYPYKKSWPKEIMTGGLWSKKTFLGQFQCGIYRSWMSHNSSISSVKTACARSPLRSTIAHQDWVPPTWNRPTTAPTAARSITWGVMAMFVYVTSPRVASAPLGVLHPVMTASRWHRGIKVGVVPSPSWVLHSRINLRQP